MRLVLADKLGQIILSFLERLGGMMILLYSVILCHFSGKFRFRVLIEQIARIGVESQPVILITGAFTGAVLEAQMLFQLQAMHMESMGGAVVGVAMFRELGPVITGLMLAGRVGSAMAAEIGTMKVTEQVDALKSMNVNPVDYLVKPRIHAMLISSPILMMEAALIGILSAYFVSITSFEVDQAYWVHFMEKFVALGDVYVSIIKSIAFGLIIALISCSEGLRTKDGAVGVGQSTMRAMVYSSVALLIANFMLTMILNNLFPVGFMK